jgi:hypothetical protein
MSSCPQTVDPTGDCLTSKLTPAGMLEICQPPAGLLLAKPKAALMHDGEKRLSSGLASWPLIGCEQLPEWKSMIVPAPGPAAQTLVTKSPARIRKDVMFGLEFK